ncbi:MAG TPA: hypothetical protein ENL27_01920, partial [Candidatus Parcubacteria bacterium]|nr:hypothetical protein [Candidatus Parcubacteria bacterium]
MIPSGARSDNICAPDKRRRLVQPKLDGADFAERILRLCGCLSIDAQITSRAMEQETKRLLEIISMDPQIANIANGVYLPVLLPNFRNPNSALEEELCFYQEGVAVSYKHAFGGNREFLNLCGRQHKVSVVDEKQSLLLSKMREGRGPFVALYFPGALW